jgi:hypothetical protein
VPLIALSLVVAFIYGSMIWHIFPWSVEDTISWEGHLAGGLVGIVLSVCYRKEGPQKPVVQWDEDENDDNILNESVESDENNDTKTLEINE